MQISRSFVKKFPCLPSNPRIPVILAAKKGGPGTAEIHGE
jgi:hypothetical protein